MSVSYRSFQIDLCVSQSNCSLQNRKISAGEIIHINIRDREEVIVECKFKCKGLIRDYIVMRCRHIQYTTSQYFGLVLMKLDQNAKFRCH